MAESYAESAGFDDPVMGLQLKTYGTARDILRLTHHYDTMTARIATHFASLATRTRSLSPKQNMRAIHIICLMEDCGWGRARFAQAYDPASTTHYAMGILPEDYLIKFVVTNDGPRAVQVYDNNDRDCGQLPEAVEAPAMSRLQICRALAPRYWPESLDVSLVTFKGF